ncbi:MAG TPA: SpoIIE family protein phosphatase [Spirochaetales bacterium]|nr:SpoIIE family protein phosphatase [Spirochaetales bacterium]
MKRYLVALLCALTALTANAQFVDLGESMFYVRVGFEDSWTRTLPRLDDGDWTILEPTRGERALIMRDLGLPGSPEGGVLSLFRREPLEYTVLVPFQADLTLLNSSDPALFLKHVGQEWAVYLNGVLLRNEFVSSGDGYEERSMVDVVVPLDKRRLTRGANLLAFRIRGDPVDDRTGFNQPGPYVIDSYRSLVSRNSEYIDLMLIGIYAFFALYHGVLYALRPKDKAYLYFSASALLMALYMWSRSAAATELVANTGLLRYIEYASLFMLLPAVVAFIRTVLDDRPFRMPAILAAASAALAAAGLFLRLEAMLYAWYLVAAVGSAYALGVVVRKAAIKDESAGDGSARLVLSRGEAIWIIAGVLAFAAGAALDVWVVVSVGGNVVWSKYGFFLFSLTMSATLAGRFSKIAAAAEAMNADLEAEVASRTSELSAAAAERLRLNEELSSANARLSDSMEEAERDLRIASSVQKGFFPGEAPAVGDWDVAFAYEPASGVSGDFYDFYSRDGALTGAVLGTVSGAGIASGLVTVLAKNVFSRGMAELSEEPLSAMLVEVNRRMIRELSAVGNTVSCAFMRFAGDRVEYVNAAHTDALLRRAGKRAVSLVKARQGPSKAPPLGRDDFEARVGALAFSAKPGDALLVYTAGLVNGANAKGAPYGVERLSEAFARADPDSAESTLASLMIDYRNYLAGSRRGGDVGVMVFVKR